MNFDCRFLIHGWGSDRDSFFNVDGTEAYLKNGEFNVIRFEELNFISNHFVIFDFPEELTGHVVDQQSIMSLQGIVSHQLAMSSVTLLIFSLTTTL